MKKGLILYVSGDQEDLQEEINLNKTKEELGVDFISLAFSESDIAYMWWQMVTRGVHVITCRHAFYEPKMDTLIHRGTFLRLCG